MPFKHPLAHVDKGFDRISPVYLADYATADDGTGIVHSAPAYGVDDFNSCVPTAWVRRHPQPRAGQRRVRGRLPLFGGQHIWKAVPVILDALKVAGRLMDTTTPTATRTAGATRRR
jgi:isoleucyl-tRNA synthetase